MLHKEKTDPVHEYRTCVDLLVPVFLGLGVR